MAQPHLFQVLSSFNKREIRRFKAFLKSDYFNQSQTINSLFEYIIKDYPNFESSRLKKERIHRALKPSTAFSKKFVNDRIADLFKLVKLFLAIESISKNPDEISLSFINYMQKNNKFQLFEKFSEAKIRQLENKPQLDWQHYFKVWYIKEELFKHPLVHKFEKHIDSGKTIMPYLDEAYTILKLRYGLRQELRQNIFNNNLDNELLFLDLLKDQYTNSKNPTILIYIALLNHFNDSRRRSKDDNWNSNEVNPKANNETFEEVYELYEQHQKTLPFEDKHVFLSVLIHFKNRQAIQKAPEHFKDILKLYQTGLKDTPNIWIQYNVMSDHVFKNIVVSGASAQEFDWTEQFIDTYSQYLQDREDSNTLKYAKAYLYFHKEDYKEVLDILQGQGQPILLQRYNDKLDFRSLYVRTLYEVCQLSSSDEQNFVDHLYSSLSNFSRFIQRKLSKEKREAYQNLIFFIQKMHHEGYMLERDKKLKEELLEMYKQKSKIAASNWVLDKINEF